MLGRIKRLKAAEGSPEPTPFDHFLKVTGGYLPSPQARWCTQNEISRVRKIRRG